MRSFKPHWTPGKIWVFYWDEEKTWVLLTGAYWLPFETFEQLQNQLNWVAEKVMV
jgi:hypothetical protein